MCSVCGVSVCGCGCLQWQLCMYMVVWAMCIVCAYGLCGLCVYCVWGSVYLICTDQ